MDILIIERITSDCITEYLTKTPKEKKDVSIDASSTVKQVSLEIKYFLFLFNYVYFY